RSAGTCWSSPSTSTAGPASSSSGAEAPPGRRAGACAPARRRITPPRLPARPPPPTPPPPPPPRWPARPPAPPSLRGPPPAPPPARRPARPSAPPSIVPSILRGPHARHPDRPPPHPADHLRRPRLRRSLLARQRGRPHPAPGPPRRRGDELRQRLRHRPHLLALPGRAHRGRAPAALGRPLVLRLLVPARAAARAARAAGRGQLPHRLLRQGPLRLRTARRPRLPRASRLRLLVLRHDLGPRRAPALPAPLAG